MAHLFVSDLHLDGAHPEACEEFLRVLEGPATAAQSLYVLGDLFETWIGDDDTDPARARVCDGLAALARSGVPVFVMHGNRDFLFGAEFEARTGARLLPDPSVANLDGIDVALSHGDLLCVEDLPYQELRTIVRDARFQRRFLGLERDARVALADAARAGSRAHTSAQRAEIMDVDPQAVEKLLRVSGADWLIHGHTHRPGLHELVVDGRPRRRLVLDSWYDRGQLVWWERGEVRITPLPARPSGT